MFSFFFFELGSLVEDVNFSFRLPGLLCNSQGTSHFVCNIFGTQKDLN